MEKHRCKVKFHNGKIVCASEILCLDCPEKDKCEDIDVYIDDKYWGSKDCMSHDSYERRNKRIRQKRWGKDG
ncbi:hypothetical protein [Marinisporobacter balticus]|uniref:Uncharacterized protein n=1 Tax=Marinisporobacter balticus TaxID=2018667 RepID=A0A4V6NPH6_9FIRM|nr:hypothetical protein [Marinisporobacter balticus]TCO79120.1 hypothetical protein EV214_103172 [Marinisporobacter balticus]